MSMRIKPVAGVYGRVGASLDSADFGTRGSVGAYGEEKTAQILNSYGNRCAVIHDVIVPKLSANLDHVVVSGKKVLIIDTKAWKDGFYHQSDAYTSGVHRGDEFVDHANKGGLERMEEMMYDHLSKHTAGMSRDDVRSVLIVWPSPKSTQLLLDASLNDRKIPIMPAYKLDALMKQHLGLRRRAKYSIVNTLNQARFRARPKSSGHDAFTEHNPNVDRAMRSMERNQLKREADERAAAERARVEEAENLRRSYELDREYDMRAAQSQTQTSPPPPPPGASAPETEGGAYRG